MGIWTTLQNSAAYLLVLAAGYGLKRLGVFTAEHAAVFAKLIMTMTLPAAVLKGAASAQMNGVLFLAAGVGFFANVLLLSAAVFVSRKLDGDSRAFCVLNTNTFNIGNFAMPFLSAFTEGQAFAAICMFDMGSALTTFGPNFTVAQAVWEGTQRVRIRPARIIKTLLGSPTFDVYLAVLAMHFFHLQLPSMLFDAVSMAAGANTFLAMLTIGILFEFRFPRAGRDLIVRVLATRYLVCALAALAVWFFFPADAQTVRVLCITLFAPIANCATIFTVQHRCDGAVSAVINSFSMVISVCIMILLLSILPMPIR